MPEIPFVKSDVQSHPPTRSAGGSAKGYARPRECIPSRPVSQNMINDRQTPAPTRRFLPSSSASKSSGLGSIHRNPFSSSHPTQPSSFASPFAATPRFQRPNSIPRPQDDIETAFDDDDYSPILLKGRPTPGRKDVHEAIEDESEGTSPLLSKGIFTPVTKRRKIESSKGEGPITISSSPDEEELGGIENHHQHNLLEPQSDGEEESDLDVNSPEVKVSRFKVASRGPAEPNSVSRGLFKSTAEGGHPGNATTGTALPDIFSPSRRKGKRDYVPGGTADLVRNWVLSIAAQEPQITASDEVVVVISQIKEDSSGRFVLVVDEDGSQWLLPEQHNAGVSSTVSQGGLCPGWKLLLKGHATKWAVPFGSHNLNDVMVAAYWEVLSES